MQIEGDYYSREAPTLAPTGSGQVGVETRPGRAKVALLRPADGTSKGCKNVALPRFEVMSR